MRLLTLFLFTALTAHAAQIDRSQLAFVGDASMNADVIRLTPPAMGKAGAVWFRHRIKVSEGFDTTFMYKITELGNGGADGFAFVVQNNGAQVIGGGGGYLGYGGIMNSLAVEFDTAQNGGDFKDPNANHIAVITRGKDVNLPLHDFQLGIQRYLDFTMIDGRKHTARVNYVPGTMSVFLEGSPKPALIAKVILEEKLALDDGEAWIGLTAGTGAAFAAHDILNWDLNLMP